MNITLLHKNSRRIMKRSALMLAVFAISSSTLAATRIKQNNTDDLNLSSSWDTLPGLLDIAQWDSTVTGANSTVLGTDLTWAGIKIVSPGGTVTIGGGNTLTVGTSGIDLSTATQSLTLTSGLKLQGQQSWKAAAGRTLDVAGAFTRSGAYVDFSSFNASAFLNTLGNTYNILGPWAYNGTVTTLKYVTTSGGTISAYTGATADAGNLASVTSATDNYKYSAAATLGGNRTGNTLQYTGAATTTALGTYSLTLNGLMNAGSGKLTITGAVGGPGVVAGASGELDIISNNQSIDISAMITGTGALVYGGPSAGQLNLMAPTNTFSGGTVINAGTLTFPSYNYAPNPVLGTGPVTINGPATLKFDRQTVTNSFTLNGAIVMSGNSFSSSIGGPVTLLGTSTLNITGGFNITGAISGSGGLTKTGTSMVPLIGSNTYSGATTISAGALQFKKSLYGNDTAQWIPANISVATNAILSLNVGGSGEFTAAQAGLLFSQLTTVNNNGLKAGALFGFDTANASPTTVTLATNLTDSTGTGGGSVGIRKYGANTLELTGSNTFSGKTYIDGGILKVSSLNYINSGTLTPNTSSSLGKPTSVSAGTIEFPSTGGTLLYAGTGETTDRVLNFTGGNATLALDQSGTGLLKFTSAFTTSSGSTRTFNLQGSTAGTGEVAATIPDPSLTVKASVTKAGSGTWTLSANNAYTGVTTLNGGALVLTHSTALPGGLGVSGGLSPLTFNGGVLGLGAGDFTRGIASAGTATGVNFSGNGGWAAYGAARVVNLGGASAQIVWTNGTAGFNSKNLILGATTATHTVDFQNPIDLVTGARTVQTDKGSPSVDAIISGVISGGAGGNLTKTGTGTLALTAMNTYTGTTTVSAGTLLVNGALGTNTVTVNSGATLGGTGTLNGKATFSSGAKGVFTVTRNPVTESNTTPLTVIGVMSFTGNEIHLNLPANLPSGAYALATSPSTPSGTVLATPVVDSGSYAAGFTSATVTLDTVNKVLLLTVNGLPTYPTALAITSVNGGVSPSAGVPFSVVVESQDANGAARRVLADTAVTLSVKTGTGSLGGTVSGTILAGTSAVTISGVTYSMDESGVVLTATRTSGDSLTAGDSASFTVLPDTTPVALDISTLFPSPQTAGVGGTLTVTAKTASGATATAYTGTVHFSTSAASAGLPVDYTFVPGDNGTHLFTGVTLNTAGMQSITVTDTVTPSLTDTQTGIVVTPATAATLVVSGFPSPQGTGVLGSVTVTAKDAFGNTDTNYTGTIHFTSSDLSAGLPGDYTFTGGDLGTHTFVDGALLTALGLQSITATDTVTGSITGTQSNITIWILPTVFTWTNTVSGSWSSAGNWTNDMGVFFAPASAGQPDYTLKFNAGTYAATHNLNNGFVVNQLHFAGAVTIAGSSSIMLTNNGATPPQINQNSANSVLMTVPLYLGTSMTVGGSGNGNLDLFGALSGTGSLLKTNAGTLILSSGSGNSYSGGTTVNKGALNLGTQGSALFGTGPVTANPGTTLNLNGNSGGITNAFVLTGATVVNGNGFSAILNGPVSLTGTNTFDLGGSGNMSINGVLSGSGGLTKIGIGGGPLYLNATNTFTGTTTVSAGTLQVSESGQLASLQVVVTNTALLKISNSSSLAETTTLTITDGGAKIDIPNGVTQTVTALYLGSDGKPELIGSWGHSSSDAVNKDDVHFTATSGKLRVLTGLQRGMVITLH